VIKHSFHHHHNTNGGIIFFLFLLSGIWNFEEQIFSGFQELEQLNFIKDLFVVFKEKKAVLLSFVFRPQII
jgi:hypothetical protein